MPSILNATTTNGLVTSADNSGSLQLQTNNGTTAVTIDTNQNVGIGMTNQTQPLMVKTDTDFVIGLGKTSAGSGARIGAYNSALSAYKNMVVDGETVQLATGGAERMRIDSSGNVGIGTNSPNAYGTGYATLQVNGANSGIIQATSTANAITAELTTNSTAGVVGTRTNHPLVIKTNDAERMRLDASGNLLFNSGYGSVATAYGCRAWVNFNGTGTVAIRGSGNVSSITDNSAGAYTVNFTNNLPDANYATLVTFSEDNTVATTGGNANGRTANNATTSSVRVQPFKSADDNNLIDAAYVYVAVFR